MQPLQRMFVAALAIIAITAVIDRQFSLSVDQQRYLMAAAGTIIAIGYVISWKKPK